MSVDVQDGTPQTRFPMKGPWGDLVHAAVFRAAPDDGVKQQVLPRIGVRRPDEGQETFAVVPGLFDQDAKLRRARCLERVDLLASGGPASFQIRYLVAGIEENPEDHVPHDPKKDRRGHRHHGYPAGPSHGGYGPVLAGFLDFHPSAAGTALFARVF
jgi:hypothetical protein